jgi:hypothetical protein
MVGWQVSDGECEGTQTVKTDDPALIVDGDENTHHVTFLVLTGTRWNQSSSAATPRENAVWSRLPSGSIDLIMHDQPKRSR